MSQLLAILALLVLAAPAAAQEAPRLNSERIKARFGSYGIRVLEREPLRVSMLYSTHEGREVCRTLALVRFVKPVPPALQSPMGKVRAGASLGATLKKAGWKVSKRYLHLGTIHAGPRFLNLAGLDGPQDLAVAAYELSASKGDAVHPVATIIEIHHPDYLTLDQLRKLTPKPQSVDGAPVSALLRLAAESMLGDKKD